MYILLLVGFMMLVKGADFFVEGSSTLAKMCKIPSVVVGLTIVAMGTSAPEASVSITAGLTGNNDIALSNILGSNIFNLLMVIGVCAAIKGVDTERDMMKRDLPINILATALLLIVIRDCKISRIEGIFFIVCLAVYLVVIIRKALQDRANEEENEENEKKPPLLCGFYMIGGLCCIIYGGNLVVEKASEIATAFGLSETLIGLTIVAMGTSLPELVTSVVATIKGDSGLALGNAVGSCIFNILFILGVSAGLSPIIGSMEVLIDTAFLLVVAIITYLFAKSDKKTIRLEGILCIGMYALYMVYAVIR